MTAARHHLADLVTELTLQEKVALVSGRDFWTTTPIDRIGLRTIVLSDGPAGVRGPIWDERSPSLSLPSGTALASSWDPEVAYRFGVVAASEARRKGVHVVLGPTINLHRSPLGGRHFECFSEDPLLSGQLAAAYVQGLQDNGVAASPKHYVANDSETDRFNVDIRVSERALREVYLLPFEVAVQAGAWTVMSAYNAVGGVTMTENSLLETPLSTEWGFDGVVVSDWTAVRSLAAASASQDLAMPGPVSGWSGGLLAAVRDGSVDAADVDRKVERILRLAERVGALGDVELPQIEVDGPAFAREAAADGMVLLENRDELPWDGASIRSIAVIGDNARAARTQGGGSATVLPERVISPLDGIRAALPDAVVTYELGARVHQGLEELPRSGLSNPSTGADGVHLTYLGEDGVLLLEEERLSTALVWFDGGGLLAQTRRIVLETSFTPAVDEVVEFGFASAKPGRIWVDGELHVAATPVLQPGDPAAAFLSPPSSSRALSIGAGRPVRIRAEFDFDHDASDVLGGAASATLGWAPEVIDPEELIKRAAEAARTSDVALVVVGTNAVVETEGVDRVGLDLPGRQDDLVRAVIKANPRTVVIVNSGAPVRLPWRTDAAAVVLGHFGGQEFGSAVADVVLGMTEPGGRLTTTWPSDVDDVPVLDVTPQEGVLHYDEGIHVGYRAWLATGRRPAYPFGWGLGYTSWDIRDLCVDGDVRRGEATLHVVAENTGGRGGKQVVQVYAERATSTSERPKRWLVGSAVARADAGQTVDLVVPLGSRRFAHWVGERSGDWAIEPGVFILRVGTSVADLPLSIDVLIEPVDADS
jgi:beta-glucosidase